MSVGCQIWLTDDNDEEERGEKRKVIGSTDQDIRFVVRRSSFVCFDFLFTFVTPARIIRNRNDVTSFLFFLSSDGDPSQINILFGVI